MKNLHVEISCKRLARRRASDIVTTVMRITGAEILEIFNYVKTNENDVLILYNLVCVIFQFRPCDVI